MCNLYSHTRNVEAMRKLFAKFDDAGVNMPSMPGIFPDYPAPIVRNDEGGVGGPICPDSALRNIKCLAERLCDQPGQATSIYPDSANVLDT